MEFFAINAEVARWETLLATTQGVERVPVLCLLAWHLRQRDTRRALQLVDEVRLLLQDGSAINEHPLTQARLQLVEAEAQWLFADLASAEASARNVLQIFTTHRDWCSCADAQWLLGWIAIDSGKLELGDAELEAMIGSAEQAADGMRLAVAQAAIGRMAALRNPVDAEKRWGSTIPALRRSAHPALQMWGNDFVGMISHYKGECGPSATCEMLAYEQALSTGQLRSAITCATNTAENFNRLNDYHSSMDWAQRGLELARQTGWPRSVGACLMHTGEIMRQLGNFDTAHEMLQEALVTLAPLAGSRPYAIALQYQGDLALDRNDFQAALEAFKTLEVKASDLQQHDFLIDSQRGQAHALYRLGRPEPALVAAKEAAASAQQRGDVVRQLEVLMVMSEIHTRYPDLPTGLPPGIYAPLHYLQAGLQATQSITGYTVTGKFLEALSGAYAASGDYVRAHDAAVQTIACRDRIHSQQITNRAVAMQVVRQTEIARAQGEYHRQLAESEAQRVAVLQQTSATLEMLGVVGQEITKHLESEDIFDVLYQHVRSMVDVASFAIYLLEPSRERLAMVFCMEEGVVMPVDHVDVSDPLANSARCIRENSELWVDLLPDSGNYMPGSLHTQCALYAPLAVGENVLGVLTIQSVHRGAYGDRERLIFRSLSAYAAIALGNAQTYARLGEAQLQLASQQKMAALGALVAGVAHELNTPVGNAILIASTMAEKTQSIAQKLDQNNLRQSELVEYLQSSLSASDLILRGLHKAAGLVSSFKQVAVDRATAQLRVFNLNEFVTQVMATVAGRVAQAGHQLRMEIPADLEMTSYPGPLGQVVTNLIENAIVHGYPRGDGGTLSLSAKALSADQVLLRFSDDGAGILQEHLPKIFDPFFTTRLGQGGSGLGLSISYNIVTSILGGQIVVQSPPGNGTTFTLTLPLKVRM